MEHKRQGDILLVALDFVPEGKEVKRTGGRLIIKAGEQTGHHHAIIAPYVKMIETTDARYIISNRVFEVYHEEHSVVSFPAGVYEIPEQVEYEPQMIRRVVD